MLKNNDSFVDISRDSIGDGPGFKGTAKGFCVDIFNIFDCIDRVRFEYDSQDMRTANEIDVVLFGIHKDELNDFKEYTDYYIKPIAMVWNYSIGETNEKE